MSLGWDPDVPAGFQDADIEMAELREAANETHEREEEHKQWEKEALMLDVQDFDELIRLVAVAKGSLIGESLLCSADMPTTRMLALTSLERKLIEAKSKVA